MIQFRKPLLSLCSVFFKMEFLSFDLSGIFSALNDEPYAAHHKLKNMSGIFIDL